MSKGAHVEEPRDKLQKEEAAPAYPRAQDHMPAHTQAAGEAAGEPDLNAGPREIGVGSAATGAHALGGQGSGMLTPRNPGQPISIFDKHRPPELDLIEDCVHCGFCLPTCPTYVLWG